MIFAARVSGRRFCAPLRFPASHVPLMCLLCASSVHLYASVPLQSLFYAPLRFYAASVHLYAFVPLLCLFKCGCQSGQRTISLSAVYNTGCIQHWMYTTLATTLACRFTYAWCGAQHCVTCYLCSFYTFILKQNAI